MRRVVDAALTCGVAIGSRLVLLEPGQIVPRPEAKPRAVLAVCLDLGQESSRLPSDIGNWCSQRPIIRFTGIGHSRPVLFDGLQRPASDSNGGQPK